MRKTYLKPFTKIHTLAMDCHLLAGSDTEVANGTVKDYNGDETVTGGEFPYEGEGDGQAGARGLDFFN